jgi:hypothetical protein
VTAWDDLHYDIQYITKSTAETQTIVIRIERPASCLSIGIYTADEWNRILF